MRKRRNQLPMLPILIGILLVALLLIYLKFFLFNSPTQAEDIVEKFYQHEQKGNFSDSWELFHPYMKERFTKSSFIQDRAHVFIGHFGADTFSYEISKPVEFDKWKPEDGQETFGSGYKMVVTQKYAGKYGKFNFQQEVYVVKHKGEWAILWDYNSK
ncbi:hypothetical protein [Bacillus sp. ISL-45]|uniref:hypothetical protein n=1 Tax=Bacillus sp. ISL-45 TaxID=2819128 RepID=UPI001BEA94E4|nr:hypothetical protein [Bacillus sp. ISL-45]MBT2661741.1 hypothetical protein [Bacillus sp. ISL-45]